MGQTHDMPFDIMDVAGLLQIRIRRPSGRGYYADCPFCGDKRGKLHLNTEFDGWKCNYCGERGGLLDLYGKLKGMSRSEAYREISDALQSGTYDFSQPSGITSAEQVKQSSLADVETVDKTFRALLNMLTLSKEHREQLRSKRGLTDEQIDRFGYRSTPPFYKGRPLAERLIAKGYTVEGVPGFYQKDKHWTVNFSTRTAGLLIPVRSIDRHICGFQIRLDVPLKDENDEPDKEGAKYIWLSSAGKPMGTSSGSPVHFVGDPFARVVYVTEGALKADVAHALMSCSFAATAGANNTALLEGVFARLAENGTQTIIEAEDMDKYRNEHIQNGASKIQLMAKRYGMDCRRLTWNPNYKGVDDWQLALRKKHDRKKEQITNFKTRFLYGLCDFDAIDDEVAAWHESEDTGVSLRKHLGLTEEEYALSLEQGYDALKESLLNQRRYQNFRIYQLRFDEKNPTIPFAFGGIKKLHKEGYEQPPARLYRLIYDGTLLCSDDEDSKERLQRIWEQYQDELPEDYPGRSVSISDVLELYDEENRRYFYVDESGFCPVKFSPLLAGTMKNG